ncbi:MAG: hypothetical protein CMF52_00130 [Legionellales bacterium]|nr:hypothetical protein [Legionellales bacterium]
MLSGFHPDIITMTRTMAPKSSPPISSVCVEDPPAGFTMIIFSDMCVLVVEEKKIYFDKVAWFM